MGGVLKWIAGYVAGKILDWASQQPCTTFSNPCGGPPGAGGGGGGGGIDDRPELVAPAYDD